MNKYFNISVASEDFLGLDISDSSSEKQNTKALAEIINNVLGEFTDQWFTEYSVMPSTLDLSIKRLKCFSVVYGSEKFKNDISQNTKNLLNSRISEELTKLIGKKVKADLGEDVLFAEGVPAEEQPGVEKYILENYGLKTVFK